MRVVNIEKVNQFLKKHPDVTSALQSWLADAKNASWKNTSDVKLRYPSASFIRGNRVVFNIKGNKFRLIVKINYDYGVIEIRFVDTHAEYDRIDAETV